MEAVERERVVDADKVWVRNISWATDEAALAAFFVAAGPVTSAEVMRTKDGKKSLGRKG